jgi:hypothetical protein
MDEELTPRERQLLEEDDRETDRVPLWLCAILGPPALALVLVVWQSYVWLKKAEWPSYTLRSIGIEPPVFDWLGVNQIVLYVYDAPLSLLLALAGVIATFLFTRNDNKPVSDELRNARGKRARLFRDRQG